MFLQNQPQDQADYYKKLLKSVGSLSKLFSDSVEPYLAYRIAENIFCKAFGAENVSRKDASVDAAKNGIGVGLKTFLEKGGNSMEKVAEFNKDHSLFRNLFPEEKVRKIAELRNERLALTQRLFRLDKMIYHCVVRQVAKMLVYESPLDFIDIDNMLSGLHPSNLIILAARPGQGKTAFVINIAQYASIVNKHSVGIFSLEMSKEELVDRLLVSQSDIDAWRLKTGKLTEDDYGKLSVAMGQLAEAPIFIDDTPGLSIPEMRTKARRLQSEHNLKLLIVDYLQLATTGKKFENRVNEVSYISQSLKNMARELKIPVIGVSQLSRAVEQRGGGKPQLADLRESGAIEQDADVVMFLYSPDEEFTSQRIVNVFVAKHRNGPVGEKELLFRGDRIRFYNVEHTTKV